ncbi:MAG: DPP IV N-terminal domain-containing protein [Chloroflexi bacterium]|nr:DPP IV N-terminal domain-containing protein [Chloroflexota bacterium]
MKKIIAFVSLSFVLVMTLACQQITNLGQDDSNPTPRIVNTVIPPTATMRIATPTPTESLPPAEGWIAFINQNNVWLIHPDGSGLTQITKNPFPIENDYTSNDIEIEWSPDGRKLAILLQSGELYVVDIQGLSITLLTDSVESNFDWSITGKQILYDTKVKYENTTFNSYNQGLWVINVDNRNKRQIVSPTKDVSALASPQWSSDNKYIIFDYPSGFEFGGFGVVEVGTTNFVRILTAGNFSPYSCSWVPSKPIISCGYAAPGIDPEIIFLDIGGNIIERYTLPIEMRGGSIGPWSHFGEYLAFAYSEGTLAESTLHRLTGVFFVSTGSFQPLALGGPSGWSPKDDWFVTEEWTHGIETMQMVNVKTGESHPFVVGMSARWQPTIDNSGLFLDVTETPSLFDEVVPNSTMFPTLTPLPGNAVCTDSTIHIEDTTSGDFLYTCFGGQEYKFGPLEKGGYAMGPNGKFFVYATNSGYVYAARLDDMNLTPIGKVKDFVIIKRGEAPEYRFEFRGTNPYSVEIFEMVMKESRTISIPRRITAE